MQSRLLVHAVPGQGLKFIQTKSASSCRQPAWSVPQLQHALIWADAVLAALPCQPIPAAYIHALQACQACPVLWPERLTVKSMFWLMRGLPPATSA